MGGSEPIWSVKVAVDDIPDTGAHIHLSADESTRSAIAKAAGLRELPRLEASFDLRRQGRAGLHVTGEVTATAGQNCVVTLDPIENEIAEGVDVMFAPSADQSGNRRAEATMRFSDAESPELLTGGSVDLGAVATEFLLLGIDPYPRRDDAVFEAAPAGDPRSHPFAALAALKKATDRDG